MNNQAVFQRYEMKYLITEAQYARLKEKICRYMIDDRYGQSSICNLYFDTPSFLLIRRSIERPVYKEKLRLRSYGVAVPDSTVFIEMKKKYRSVVYKRRINTTEQEAMRYLCGGKQLADTQIAHELDYFLGQYGFPRPTVFLSYERQAFFAKDDSDFRITFDKNILLAQLRPVALRRNIRSTYFTQWADFDGDKNGKGYSALDDGAVKRKPYF